MQITQKDILIIIPARFQSTRLPGKPLIKIANKEMILRVAEIAKYVCSKNKNCNYVIATDNKKIEDFCIESNLNCVWTSEHCKNGTERCKEAVLNLNLKPSLVINLQGDNPFCPPWVIQSIIEEWKLSKADLYTPFVQLDWTEYDDFVDSKKTTPYSGTTVLKDKNNFALAFSKNIIPAIRNKEKAQKEMKMSPICKHIGLYAFDYDCLINYNNLEISIYEKSFIEGLEQMRFLYNDYKIKMVEVDYKGRDVPSGIDSPEDLVRAENYILKFGELFKY